MRKKNMIFGVLSFILALCVGGQAFAELAVGEISMGTFSIPLPSNGIDGKDGCSPEVTVTEKDAQTGCYTTTIQKKKLKNGSCENDGDAITRETCDGEDGANGNEIDLDDVYVPYPASTQEDGAGPNQQGFIKKLVNNEVVAKIEDYCDKDYDATNGARMKCVAQGDATAWPVGGPYYETGGTYYFTITDPADVCASVNVSDWGDTPRVTKSQYFGHSGTQTQGVVGYLDTVNTMCDGTDQENITQDFCSPVQPTVANGGTNVTCVNGYTWQRCINQTVAVSANDSQRYYHGCFPDTTGRAVVSRQTNQYQGPDLTNKIKGYIYTLVTYSNGDTDRIDKHEDECDPVIGETSASDDTLKTGQRCKCGGTTSDAPCNVANGTYLLGVYGTVQDLKDLMENQVQVIIRYDSTTQKLYYCIQDGCLSQPYTNTAYWSPVDINGLAGQDGESCLATKSGENWYVCCSPTWTGDDCNQVTDSTIISMLNGMMCQVNYTHKYLHDNNGGDPIANDVKAGAIGERIIVTNTCNSDAENLDSIYGTDGQNGQNGQNGNDYDPCDGLEAGSQDALSRVHHTTGVYISHGASNTTTTTTGIGYYQETNVMCDINGNKIVKKYDECDPVSIAPGVSRTVAGVTCSGNQTLLLCTPQQGNDSTQYPVCSDAEVADYPKAKYFEPTISNGQITAEGYTQNVHKYTANGSEVTLESDVKDPDECHTVYKVISRTANNNTVTATTQTTKKCRVQSYSHPVPSFPWTVGIWYCLNTDANGSCEEYRDSIVDSETSTLKYHLPTMDANDSTKPVSAGYTYYEVTDENDVIVREIVKDKEDKCDNKILGRNANNSSSVTVSQCTVVAPTGTPGLTNSYTSGTTYCLNYANGTCPSGLTDIGAAIDSAADAENDPCAGVANSSNEVKAKTVKKLKTREYTRATGSQGALEAVYEMCNGSDHSEATPDECKELPKPTSGTGSDCAGAWMQCGDQTLPDTNSNKIYYYCDTEADSIFNAINTAETAATAAQNAATENDPCADLNATTAAKTVKKTEYEYVAKGATGNTTGVGYVKKTKVMCDDTQAAPHKEEELMYDTCLPAAADANCSGTSARNYKCYNQTLSLSDSSREYPSCNPTSTVGTIITANAINDKLNKDVTFSTGTHNNEQYILMSAGDGTTKPVVAVDTLKPQSLFDIWKEQYKDLTSTKCAALFGSTKTDCENDLDETDMLNNISAYGVWKTDQVITQDITDNAKLNMTAYQNSLKPCQSFRIEENDQYQGGDGKQYVMTCVE